MKLPLWSIIPVVTIVSWFVLMTSENYSLEWILVYDFLIIGFVLIIYAVEKFILKREIDF